MLTMLNWKDIFATQYGLIIAVDVDQWWTFNDINLNSNRHAYSYLISSPQSVDKANLTDFKIGKLNKQCWHVWINLLLFDRANRSAIPTLKSSQYKCKVEYTVFIYRRSFDSWSQVLNWSLLYGLIYVKKLHMRSVCQFVS